MSRFKIENFLIILSWNDLYIENLLSFSIYLNCNFYKVGNQRNADENLDKL